MRTKRRLAMANRSCSSRDSVGLPFTFVDRSIQTDGLMECPRKEKCDRGHFARLRCTIALPCREVWQTYDESWTSFRGGNWRCDLRFGGGGDSGGSRDSRRGFRPEHAAIRQDRRRSAALACRAAQRGVRPNRCAHEEAECVLRSLRQAWPRF